MGLEIDPKRFYTEHELREGGFFTDAILDKARKTDGLKYREVGKGRRVYRGSWLLAWLNQPQEASGR